MPARIQKGGLQGIGLRFAALVTQLLSTKLYRLYLVSREILSRKIGHAEVIKFSFILP